MRTSVIFVALMLFAGLAWADMPGEKLFNRKCAMCHVVRGRGGAIGPDLTKVALRLSEAQLKARVSYPKKVNPGTSMPSFATLESGEMQGLINYLKTLR